MLKIPSNARRSSIFNPRLSRGHYVHLSLSYHAPLKTFPKPSVEYGGLAMSVEEAGWLTRSGRRMHRSVRCSSDNLLQCAS